MQKTKLFYFISAVLLFSLVYTASSQDRVHGNPLDAKSYYKSFGVIFPATAYTLGDSCAVTNPEKHDGFGHANGYGWLADSGRFVILFSPRSVGHTLPWTFNKVCIGLQGLSGTPTNQPYCVVIYDSTSSGPGNLLYCSPVYTASSIPPFPATTWFSSPDNFTVTHGVYIGIRIRLTAAPYTLTAADENTSTPLWPGYTSSTSPPTPWATIQSVGSFAAYRCMAIRCEGGNAAPPQAHDIAMGPWLSFPSLFLINTAYNMKGECTNVGTNSETNVPIKWFINGTLTNTTNKNLTVGQVDSVSNTWTPTTAGSYTLMYVSALATDTNHTNDTLRATVNVLASLPPLCEGFTSATFPPTQWTNTNSTYISRQAAGFGGPGSAYFDNWNQSSGVTGDLITLTFPATTAGDSIHFALAYCLWSSSSPDQIAIYNSTNAGTSYSLIHTMTNTEMVSVSSCSAPFVPSGNSQWLEHSFSLPAGTNVIKFTGTSGFGDGVYLDSVGTNACWLVGIHNQTQEIPRIYSLSQNYPNPFNPTTNIQFALPKAGDVKLIVYDILGAQVAVLVNGHMDIGNHIITFNGDNIASGVYFYELQAGDFTAVKKMVLMK